MTLSLTKFELKTLFRRVSVLWAALLCSTLFVALMITLSRSTEQFRQISTFVDITYAISVLAFIVVFTAAAAATIFLILMRFYKGLLGDEGYLMHTLPVTESQLVLAKGIGGTVVAVISMAAALLSVMIITVSAGGDSLFSLIGNIIKAVFSQPSVIPVFLELFVIMLLLVMGTIYKVYASMAVGQMSDTHRVLKSLIAYIIFGAIESVLSGILLILSQTGLLSPFAALLSNLQSEAAYMALLLIAAVGALIYIAIYHVITVKILSEKLNLL